MGANPVTITLTSSGISTPQNLDWMAAKFTSYAVSGSTSGTFTFTVEGALDDITRTASASVVWFALTSASTQNSGISVFQGPLAAIRLNASAMSSATLSMRVSQSIGW